MNIGCPDRQNVVLFSGLNGSESKRPMSKCSQFELGCILGAKTNFSVPHGLSPFQYAMPPLLRCEAKFSDQGLCAPMACSCFYMRHVTGPFLPAFRPTPKRRSRVVLTISPKFLFSCGSHQLLSYLLL